MPPDISAAAVGTTGGLKTVQPLDLRFTVGVSGPARAMMARRAGGRCWFSHRSRCSARDRGWSLGTAMLTFSSTIL
ncbi:hypothetical protein ACFFX0_19555 [Citricoccus parietis]|uniref:Uncharacterized protein n=1 Tax=Citricoccus parietis TaxID=592307 RepID=A0ABV5G471_9MICC